MDSFLILHPEFKINYQQEKPCSVSGTYSVKDNLGVVQDEFDIEVGIPQEYPLGFPVLKEISKKIPREDEFHVDENGIACVEITPVVNLISRTGISLNNFIENYVHKFLCWQILYRYDKGINYWDHKENGIKDFYIEKLETQDIDLVKKLLDSLIKNIIPQRNDACLCGSNRKYKNCHWRSFENLKQYGVNELRMGLLAINSSI